MGRVTAIFPSRERTTRPPYWAVTAAALSPSPAQTSFTRPETPALTLAETLSSALSFSCSSKSSSWLWTSARAVRTLPRSTVASRSPLRTWSPAETKTVSISTPEGMVMSSASALIRVPEPETEVVMLPRSAVAERRLEAVAGADVPPGAAGKRSLGRSRRASTTARTITGMRHFCLRFFLAALVMLSIPHFRFNSPSEMGS